MLLSAELLTTFQRCARHHAVERDYEVIRWRPKRLLDAVLREAIFALSQGGNPQTIAESASVRFLEAAARPGLDILTDPYTLSRDYCAIIHTVLEAVSRLTLLVLRKGPLMGFDPHRWQVAAFFDGSGLLHRWVTVDRWDDDAKYRELHSWAVFGDCAATQTGMWLHVIEIGQTRKGHQHTSWARAFKHPAIQGKTRFRKVDGGPLEGNWRPVWYQDSDKNTAKTWVDLMEADRLELIHHMQVSEPSSKHAEQFRREIAMEAIRMQSIDSWSDAPMSRPACDTPFTCPWQPVCYGAPGLVDVEAVGGFKKKERGT